MSTLPIASRAPFVRVDPVTGELRHRRYRVTVLSGPERGRVVDLQEPLLIGTRPDLGLCLTDPTASRVHAELEPRADGVFVRDLESTNGTLVGGVRIDEGLIANDGTLEVGNTKIRVAVVDDELLAVDEAQSFGEVVGATPVMRKLFGLLDKIAPTQSTVLINGETGTGKDVVARSIHQRSTRAEKPFVVFDCVAVPPQLMESELFGHVRGAFTDAATTRLGAFERADGGTLFLDEIGDMPLVLQSRLLRALENSVVKPVGADRSRRVNVRVIAATHRNLLDEVKAGRFRQDLYFRIAVVPVMLPPLRERLNDLPLLVRHFVAELGRGDFELSAALLERMRSYRWPGNVRELKNLVVRLLSGVAEAEAVTLSTTAAAVATPRPDEELLTFKEAKERLLADFARDYLTQLLARSDGNVSRAAVMAGVARSYLQTLMAKYGIKASGEET